jgi:hypothetical protein
LWSLGKDRRSIDQALLTNSSLSTYLEFMTSVLRRIRLGVRRDGYACLVIGDVRRGEIEINLAREAARNCVADSGLQFMGIITFSARQK